MVTEKFNMDRYGCRRARGALYRGGEQRSKVTMYKTLVQRGQLWLFVSWLRVSCPPKLPDASVLPSTSSHQVSTLSASSASSAGCIARPLGEKTMIALRESRAKKARKNLPLLT